MTGCVLLVTPPGEHRRRGLDAVRLAGAMAAAERDWGEPLDIDADVLLLDATGQTDDSLAAALEELAADERPIVALFSPEQIDVVAEPLLGRAQLLCDADLPEIVTALVLATARPPGGVRDPGRDEAEAARLLRLSEEVARIADALGRIARREPERGGAVGERALSYRAPPPDVHPPAVTAAELRAAIQSRRLRDEAFGVGWFEDPAWDMLLDLYAAELERARVSVSSLCIAAAVAPTTALRWIARMTEGGLLERRPDPRDRRRVFMGLTDGSRAALERYLAAVKRAGLAIA